MNVKKSLNDLKEKQEAIRVQIDERDVELKAAEHENYELEQKKLSLERQEILLQQKISTLSSLLQKKEEQINAFVAMTKNFVESSETLSSKTNDIDARHDEVLEQLKNARDSSNRAQMQYDELKKRLVNVERNLDITNERASKKEEKATKLADSLNSASLQIQNFNFVDSEDGTLSEQVSEMQSELREANQRAEVAERKAAGIDQLIKSMRASILKQRQENERIKSEMDVMQSALES